MPAANLARWRTNNGVTTMTSRWGNIWRSMKDVAVVLALAPIVLMVLAESWSCPQCGTSYVGDRTGNCSECGYHFS